MLQVGTGTPSPAAPPAGCEPPQASDKPSLRFILTTLPVIIWLFRKQTSADCSALSRVCFFMPLPNAARSLFFGLGCAAVAAAGYVFLQRGGGRGSPSSKASCDFF